MTYRERWHNTTPGQRAVTLVTLGGEALVWIGENADNTASTLTWGDHCFTECRESFDETLAELVATLAE